MGNNEFLYLKETVFDHLKIDIRHTEIEKESSDYGALEFSLNESPCKFRVGKITPTKPGFFVTLWKRSSDGVTMPHDETDPYLYYFFSVKNEDCRGVFIFPKQILILKGILSSSQKEGKRGFRLYAPWSKTQNAQAKKTQSWQKDFYIDISNPSKINDAELSILLLASPKS